MKVKKQFKRVCLECNKEFYTTAAPQKVCGEYCSMKRLFRRNNLPEPDLRYCECGCDELFIATSLGQIYKKGHPKNGEAKAIKLINPCAICRNEMEQVFEIPQHDYKLKVCNLCNEKILMCDVK